jgi:hypothetical protein
VSDPAVHQASYEFADRAALDRAMSGGEALKTLVADFNRDWPRCHAHARDFCTGGGVWGRVIPPRRAAQRNPPFVLRQRDLLRQINLILPVQSCLQKDIRSRLTQIKSISLAVPSPRGAYRDRHGRGMGCGGRGSVGRVT